MGWWPNRVIYEIPLQYKTQDWVVKRERTDKSFPNAFTTAVSVMNTIKYPVDKARLLDYLARHCYRMLPVGNAPPPGGATDQNHRRQ